MMQESNSEYFSRVVIIGPPHNHRIVLRTQEVAPPIPDDKAHFLFSLKVLAAV